MKRTPDRLRVTFAYFLVIYRPLYTSNSPKSLLKKTKYISVMNFSDDKKVVQRDYNLFKVIE